MLTIPVKKKGLRFEKLNEVKFLDHKFIQIHLKTIYHSYSKSKYFKEYFPTIEKIYNETKSKKLLVDVNINLIKGICELIGIKSQFIIIVHESFFVHYHCPKIISIKETDIFILE